AVIPLLMLAQEQDGWVTRAAIEHVAEMLGMPDIRVLEVATFYTQFQLKPVGGRAHIQVCGTTPCMLMGAEALMDVCRSKINHDQQTPNANGTLSWEEVECLGACANAPMIMIFKDTYEDLTPERLAEIIDAFEAGKGDTIKPGPQTDRWYSAPAGGNTSLKADPGKGAKPAAAKASAKGAGAEIPPSNAGKPVTASLMTSPAVKTPSKAKASANGEKAASVAAPAQNKSRANEAAAPVDGVTKQRTAPGHGLAHTGKQPAAKAP
ncbi:NADH-quinone oxidoreductase subunit NuoE, partial [Escherichia coli]|nr:NADH-quinone oxidoreductase subunit NuoE [Escherichia coli]